MAQPYTGDIRMFAGNFSPRNYAMCYGALLAIADNNALFSLIGTLYGGDGRSSFGLPDMRGRIPVNAGAGPGLTPRPQGTTVGQDSVTLTLNQLPNHSHDLKVTNQVADQTVFTSVSAIAKGGHYLMTTKISPSASGTLAEGTLSDVGATQSHSNIMPTNCINFIIAMQGIYPSRN